jgi:hypothetical protein
MKATFKLTGLAIVVMGAFAGHTAWAFDLDGAWATQVSACDKIFGKTAQGELYITKDADNYGSGFIVRKDSIIGKIAKCAIKTRKAEGPLVHVIATCSTDVALQTMQFSFRIRDENNIIRIYPGVEELSTRYGRCPF